MINKSIQHARRMRQLERLLNKVLGTLLGMTLGLAIFVPIAYEQRGYSAIGGEIIFIVLLAMVGGWIAEGLS